MHTEALKWGILGTASIAKRAIIPGIAASASGEVVAIASRSLEKAQAFAAEHDIKTAYGSYEELLADEEIEAVYIPLPNHLHKEWVIKAAEAGKHVLCEKPIALHAEEAEEMKGACEQHRVVLAEAFMYRYQARYKDILAHIDNGDIGEIRGIRAVFTFNNASAFDNFRMKRAYGGGGLYDVGVYPLSLARLVFGEEPEAVTMHSFMPDSHDQVDMVAAGLVEFSNGRYLTFDCGMWAAFRDEAEIIGTKGRITIPTAFTNEANGYDLYTNDGHTHFCGNAVDHYALQADAFAATVRNEKPLPFSAEDAVLNMKVLDACLKSQLERKRIEVER